MQQEPSELLNSLKHALQSPTFYGSPEYAEGLAMGLAASWIRESNKVSLDVAFKKVFELVRIACGDISRSRTQAVSLCCDTVQPELKISFEALRKHGEVFLGLLKEEIKRG